MGLFDRKEELENLEQYVSDLEIQLQDEKDKDLENRIKENKQQLKITAVDYASKTLNDQDVKNMLSAAKEIYKFISE